MYCNLQFIFHQKIILHDAALTESGWHSLCYVVTVRLEGDGVIFMKLYLSSLLLLFDTILQ